MHAHIRSVIMEPMFWYSLHAVLLFMRSCWGSDIKTSVLIMQTSMNTCLWSLHDVYSHTNNFLHRLFDFQNFRSYEIYINSTTLLYVAVWDRHFKRCFAVAATKNELFFRTTTTHAVQTQHFASGPLNDLCGSQAQPNQNTKGNQTKLCTCQE